METDFIVQYKEKSKVKSQKTKNVWQLSGLKAKKSKPVDFDFLT